MCTNNNIHIPPVPSEVFLKKLVIIQAVHLQFLTCLSISFLSSFFNLKLLKTNHDPLLAQGLPCYLRCPLHL